MGIASDGGLFSSILKYDIRIVFDRAIRRHTMDIELWAIAYKFCRRFLLLRGRHFVPLVYCSALITYQIIGGIRKKIEMSFLSRFFFLNFSTR